MTPLLAVQWIGVAGALVVLVFLTVWLTVEIYFATISEARKLGLTKPQVKPAAKKILALAPESFTWYRDHDHEPGTGPFRSCSGCEKESA